MFQPSRLYRRALLIAGAILLGLPLTVPAASAAMPPACCGFGTGTHSIAWNGSGVLVTATDGAGSIYFWWQANGSTTWNGELVAAAGTVAGSITYHYPSIASTGTGVVITAVDSADNLDYWWAANGTTTWHQQTVATTHYGYQAPSIAWTGSAVIIAAADNVGGHLDYWWQAAGTTPWNQQTVASSSSVTDAYSPPDIAWTGSSVVIAAADHAGNLDYWWQAAGTTPWNQQTVAAGGAGTSYNSYNQPSIAWTGSAVIIADTDYRENVDYWWQAAGTTPWNQQIVASGNFFSGGDAPSIGATSSGVIITYNNYFSGDLDYWWQANGTASWYQQTVAPGSAAFYSSPSIAWTGTAVIIAASDTTGHLDYWWQANGTTPWNKQTVA